MSGLWEVFLYHNRILGLFHHIKCSEPQGIAIHPDGVKQHLF